MTDSLRTIDEDLVAAIMHQMLVADSHSSVNDVLAIPESLRHEMRESSLCPGLTDEVLESERCRPIYRRSSSQTRSGEEILQPASVVCAGEGVEGLTIDPSSFAMIPPF